uniref:Uncharacterized protein n=1 Tax=Aureoumbra lagunensis TaxID=44058 RepID=A0A7S3JUD7_9STRA|mmetsp:Transcript_14279/g.19089  ORF Transcript_14279/g.19089 Transcript_14279/m.19089 type:complete len:726 (-) Transcript_14279:366-2543(-)
MVGIKAVKAAIMRVVETGKKVASFPLQILAWGGWPMYLMLLFCGGLSIFLLSSVISAASKALRPALTIPELPHDLTLKYVPDYQSPRNPATKLTPEREEEVRSEIAKNEAYCAMLNPVQQRWCRSHIGNDLLTMYNSYRRLKEEHCENPKDPTKQYDEKRNFRMRYFELDEDEYYDLNPPKSSPQYEVSPAYVSGVARGPLNAEFGEYGKPWVDYKWGTTDHDYVKRSCRFQAEPVERGHWYVNRIGPFTSRDMGSWHNLFVDAFDEWESEWDRQGTIGRYFTSSLVAVTDKHGNIIGYPPAHMHHFHLFQLDPLSVIWPHAVFAGSETHGDDSCSQSGLGAICYMKVFPAGFGKIVPSRWFFESLVNFVMPPHPDDNPEFWFEIAVLVTDDPRLDIKPSTPMALLVKALPSKVPAEAGTYKVPKNKDSMVWEVVAMPASFDILWWKWHTHYYYTMEIWALLGNGTEILGLNRKPLIMHTEPLAPDGICDRRNDPSPDPHEEFKDNLQKYYEIRFLPPMAFPVGADVNLVSERYYDVTESEFGNIERVKELLLNRLEVYNEQQRLIGGEEASFLYKIDNIEDFHYKVGSKLWTARPLTVPTRDHLDKDQPITLIGFHRRVPYLCGDSCEESQQPIRLHLLNVFDALLTDSDAAFANSPQGQRLLWKLRYAPASVLSWIILGFLALIGGTMYLWYKGKCVPVSGPCARKASSTVYYSKLNSGDVDA